MKSFLLSLALLFAVITVNAQNLYIKTFGDSKATPVIFLHGGPGYNCVNFEGTTAQILSENGFFVIVYDRRGEGRSTDKDAKFTFQETFDDLDLIYKNYSLTTAILIGHSFGGVVGILYAEQNPQKLKSLILVGAPISLQETFKTILNKSQSIYQAKNDSINYNMVNMLRKMDTSSLGYSSYCFQHAMLNGFYTPKNISDEAKNIYAKFKSDTNYSKFSSKMTFQAPMGFWTKEKYTTLNLKSNLNNLLAKKVKVYGIYGKDDGLYSNEQVMDLQNVISSDHLLYFENCSHNVFMDQQSKFIDAFKSWMK